MRIAFEQLAIFEGAWLGLVAVDDQVCGPGSSQERPFQAGRKGGAAPSEQSGRLDELDKFVPGLAE